MIQIDIVRIAEFVRIQLFRIPACRDSAITIKRFLIINLIGGDGDKRSFVARSANQPTKSWIGPEGWPIIAQRFIAGKVHPHAPRPRGTADPLLIRISNARPSGTEIY
jgi:hypothetical protein